MTGDGILSDRVVIDALVHAVIVTDATGTILLWNGAAEQLYGWAEDEVVGRSVLDVLAPGDEMATNRADLASVTAGNTATGDRSVVRRDGTLVRIHTFTRPVVDAAGTVVAVVGSSEDVTDLRLAEQRTRDLAEHFRSALEAGGLGTWRWDMATGATVWDSRLEALFGLPPGGFDGTFDTYVSLLHPEDRARCPHHRAERRRVEVRLPRRTPGRLARRLDSLDRRGRRGHARRAGRRDGDRRLLDGCHRSRHPAARTGAPRRRRRGSRRP